MPSERDRPDTLPAPARALEAAADLTVAQRHPPALVDADARARPAGRHRHRGQRRRLRPAAPAGAHADPARRPRPTCRSPSWSSTRRPAPSSTRTPPPSSSPATSRLPVDVDTWGAAAGLTDLGGRAAGQQQRPAVDGRAGPAGHRRGGPARARHAAPSGSAPPTTAGDADQLLWVTGFPLSQAGSDEQLALVVFLQLDPLEETDDPDAYLQALRERAVIATDITFTITDPRRAGQPAGVGQPVLHPGHRLRGRRGRRAATAASCRGPATDPAAVAEIRTALAERRTVTTTLLNYRKDGTAVLEPAVDQPGLRRRGRRWSASSACRPTSPSGSGWSASARRPSPPSRPRGRRRSSPARSPSRRASDAEQRAGRRRARAEPAGPHGRGHQHADRHARHGRAARPAGRRCACPRLADWVVPHPARRATARCTSTAARHRDGRDDGPRGVRRACTCCTWPPAPRAGGAWPPSRPVLLEELTAEVARRGLHLPGRAGGASSGWAAPQVLTVPMVARRRTLGRHRADPRVRRPARSPRTTSTWPRTSPRRAALAIDNVRLYQREHTVADTLQRSLLPELPEVAGHRVGRPLRQRLDRGRRRRRLLRPAAPARRLGRHRGRRRRRARRRRRGGHGPPARVLRACVWDAEDADPGAVLARVDRLVQGLRVASLATMVYARAVRPARAGRAVAGARRQRRPPAAAAARARRRRPARSTA